MRYRNVRVSVALVVMGGFVVFGLAACGEDATAPQEDFVPTLDSLQLEMAPTHSVLFARGFVGGASAVPADIQLTVQVSTDSGDQENSVAHYMICHTPAGSTYACHGLVVEMGVGHATFEVRKAVEALDMRFAEVFDAGQGAGVEVLNGTDADALAALRALPNVARADYDLIGRGGASLEREVRAALPVNRSEVIAANGALELQGSQTVTAVYEQPDGSVLTATLQL